MDLEEAQRSRELEKESGEFKHLLADELLKDKALEIVLGENLSARSVNARRGGSHAL